MKHGEGYMVVSESRVLFFASEGGLACLIGDTERYWMEPTLNQLERRLDPARFFRVSGAALINLSAVVELHPLPGGSGDVVLKNVARSWKSAGGDFATCFRH